MPLTDTTIRNAKPAAKPRRLADGGGLTLSIRPNGTKAWRLRYRFHGKEQQLSLGIYPDVSLQEARRRRDEARQLLARGVNPSDHRKTEHAATGDGSPEETFEAVGREWFAKQLPSWSDGHARTVEYRLRAFVYPEIGKLSLSLVTAPDLLVMLKPIEEREQYETASRVLSVCQQVLRYAIATGRRADNPAVGLSDALTKATPTHFAAVTKAEEVGPLLRMLDAYQGTPVVRAALRLLPLVFTRTGELRHAQWADITLDAAKPQWEFLATKTGTPHIVPLAPAAVRIFRDLHQETGDQKWCFPGARKNGRPMSGNAILAALRSLGIPQGKMTGHGFRVTARTLIREEHGFPVDAIERQLAHATKSPQGAAYDRAEHLDVRRRMMEVWSNYLDRLRTETTA